MARFACLGLEPILADSDDDDGDLGFRRDGFGMTGSDGGRKGGAGGRSDPMTDTWQNEVGTIKVNDRGMRLAQRDGLGETVLEGQVVPDQLVFGDGRVIGRGACSVVNLARHKDTGQLFAVKVFSLLDREKRRQLDREIGTLLRSMQDGCCSQLVEFFGAFKRPDGSIRVVLEFMDRGSLADVMDYRATVQTRWRERRETQVKQEREAREKRRRATEEAAKAAAKAAARAKAAAKEAKKGRKESSSYGGGGGSRGGSMANGHAYRGSDKSNRGTGRGRDRESAPTWRNQPEGLEEEDDMPATLERLGVPQQQQQHQHHRQLNGTGVRDPRDNGIGSHPQYNNSRGSRGGSEMEHGVSKRKGAGITGGEGGWIIEEAYHSAPYPQRMDSGGLPIESSRGMVKPPPLSVGACTTPAEAFLDRDRDRGDDSWGDFGDESWGAGNGDPRVMRVGLLEEPEEEEDFEAAERRRIRVATELQRQKEQEEWDKAFEEELVQTGLPEDVVAACVYQILAGLTYLHELNQLHRDIKPSNILLNAKGEVKLTDFGIARELDHAGAMVDTVVGTVRYMSPERLHGEAYGRPADVWSLGLVMIECVTQEAPYADGCSQIEILQTLKEHGGNGLLPSGKEDRAPLSEAFVEFVSSCLKVNPDDRLTTSELLESPWFVEQGVNNREEAVELLAEYLEGLYGPHAFKYFGDGRDNSQDFPMA